MPPTTPATPASPPAIASSGGLRRRGWLVGVVALAVTALPGVAEAGRRRRPIRRRKLRLTAAQRGSGRVQRIDAGTPDAVGGDLPQIERKGGFALPAPRPPAGRWGR